MCQGARAPCLHKLRLLNQMPLKKAVSRKLGTGCLATAGFRITGTTLSGCKHCPGWHNGGAHRVRKGKPENVCTCVYINNPLCPCEGAEHTGKPPCICRVERDRACGLEEGVNTHFSYRHASTNMFFTIGGHTHKELFCQRCKCKHNLCETIATLDSVLTWYDKNKKLDEICTRVSGLCKERRVQSRTQFLKAKITPDMLDMLDVHTGISPHLQTAEKSLFNVKREEIELLSNNMSTELADMLEAPSVYARHPEKHLHNAVQVGHGIIGMFYCRDTESRKVMYKMYNGNNTEHWCAFEISSMFYHHHKSFFANQNLSYREAAATLIYASVNLLKKHSSNEQICRALSAIIGFALHSCYRRPSWTVYRWHKSGMLDNVHSPSMHIIEKCFNATLPSAAEFFRAMYMLQASYTQCCITDVREQETKQLYRCLRQDWGHLL